jgi:hypothetical protein
MWKLYTYFSCQLSIPTNAFQHNVLQKLVLSVEQNFEIFLIKIQQMYYFTGTPTPCYLPNRLTEDNCNGLLRYSLPTAHEN